MLRNEIRRMTKAQDDALNLEYLRNVIIKFLELKTTRVSHIDAGEIMY